MEVALKFVKVQAYITHPKCTVENEYCNFMEVVHFLKKNGPVMVPEPLHTMH
jgi:hypothetical protein